MTVSSKVSSIIYVGDNLTTNFDVPFRFLENSDLQLSIQATDGTVTNLVLNSDYTVTGANADNGGKVHLTNPVGNQAKLSILRVMDLLQETDYRENERFPAESHERALDKLTFEVQQLQEQSDRAIKVDVFSEVDPSEIIYEIEELYDIKDSVITAANISSEIVTCSENIEAIQNAPNQATSAATSAQNAEGYASSAQNSAVTAQLMAALAQDWATKTDGKVDGTEYSSKYYAGQASTSAQTAQDALNEVNGLIATPIGTIFMSIYVDESLDIARQLNGQLISSTKFTGFRSWLNTVQTAFPSLFTTETNWQAEKTNSKLGQCGKFVIDDTAGTIRLPCVVNAQGLADLQYLGTLKSESLPNITGSATAWDDSDSQRTDFGAIAGKVTGAFTRRTGYRNMALEATPITSDNSASATMLGFNASRSSSTYQDNAPVQQEAVQYPYYIQVATGIEETLPAIREYNINTPFFFGQSMYSDVAPDNASWLVSNGQWNAKSVYPDYYNWLLKIHNGTEVVAGVSVKLSTDTYDDYDWVVNTTDETFRLPLKSKLASGSAVAGNGMALGLTNGTTNYGLTTPGDAGARLTGTVRAYGSSVSTTGGGAGIVQNNILGVTLDPTKSGIETSSQGLKLYYYVGDTVQDASLINAGAVLGQLATKTNFVEAAAASMPSNRYIDLTLGASGSTYTAPANGWFVLRKRASVVGQYVYMFTIGSFIGTCFNVANAGDVPSYFLPVKAGDTVQVDYNLGGATEQFRFIYAEGSK